MANKRDYYEVLGVQKGATEDEIKKAYKKIPSSDMAFKKEYCPYCGSSDIKSGYMGLSMDLYWYGYRCTGCGHESRAPEGMGEAKPFTVKFSYFGHNNPPRS